MLVQVLNRVDLHADQAVFAVTEIPIDTVIFVVQLASEGHFIIAADQVVIIRTVGLAVDDNERGKVHGTSACRITVTLALTETIYVCDKSGVSRQGMCAVGKTGQTSIYILRIAV